MHLGALDMSTDGIGQEAKLADICCHCNIKTFRVIVCARICRGDARRETTVERRVKQLSRPLRTVIKVIARREKSYLLREHEFADVEQRETNLLHRVCHRHSLEVASLVDATRLTVNERVVRRGVAFESHARVRSDDVFDLRT